MATHPLNWCNRAETGKTRCAQTVSRLFSARLQKFKAPSRASTATPSQFRRSRKGGNPAAFSGQATTLGPRLRGDDGERSVVGSAPAVWPFLPLMAPWIFVAGRIKRAGLSERSEFARSPSPRQKSKEGVAISGAPFFAYFLWQDKESESAPAGGEREADHHHPNPTKKPNPKTRNTAAPSATPQPARKSAPSHPPPPDKSPDPH